MATQTEQMQIEVTAKGVKETQTQMNSLNSSIANIAKSLLPAVSAMSALTASTALLVKSYKAFKDAALAQNQLTIAFNNSGRAADTSIESFTQLANQLMRISNYDDEIIKTDVLSELMAYKNIPTADIERAAKATLDLSIKTGDLGSAAEVVGRSLESPARASRQLRQAGILLTATEQKLISELEKTGQTAQAQTIIIEKLEGKYKGLAASQIAPMTQLKNAWGELTEAIGNKYGEAIDGAAVATGLVLLGMSEQIDKTTNKFIEAQRKQFLSSAEFAAGFMMNTEIVFDTIIGLVDVTSASIGTTLRGVLDMMEGIGNLLDPERLVNAIATGGLKDFIADAFSAFSDNTAKNTTYIADQTERMLSNFTNYGKNMSNTLWEAGKAFDAMHIKANTIKKDNQITLNTDGIEDAAKATEQLTEMQDGFIGALSQTADFIKSPSFDWSIPFRANFEKIKTGLDEIKESFKSLAENELASALNTMILSTESASDKLKSIWQSLANSIISEINRVIARMIIMGAINAFTGGAGGFFGGITAGLSGLLKSTGGINPIGSMGSTPNPIGETNNRSLINGLKDSMNRQPIQVYAVFDPKDMSRAVEVGNARRLVLR